MGFMDVFNELKASSSHFSVAIQGMPDGMVFVPFCYVEAAVNLLTNPALDPYGKIPEFKFCAAKVESAKGTVEAAE